MFHYIVGPLLFHKEKQKRKILDLYFQALIPNYGLDFFDVTQSKGFTQTKPVTYLLTENKILENKIF